LVSVLYTGRFWPGFAVFLVLSLILLIPYGGISAILQLLQSPLDFATALLILFFYTFYPLFYALGKSAAFVFSTDRTFTLYLMYIYDFTLLLWVVQWFFNPYPAMLAWEYELLRTIFPPMIFGNILTIVVLTIVVPAIMYALSYIITEVRNISLWLFGLSICLFCL